MTARDADELRNTPAPMEKVDAKLVENGSMLFDIIYALAARNGRETALFGDCMPRAREAFARSSACDVFPELWFEVPLAGKPWCDLHVLTARESVTPDAVFQPETTGGNPEVFAWFGAQGQGVRQLALSWDTGSGDTANPAVQLLVSTQDAQVTCDFLTIAGRLDAVGPYRTFCDRLPQGWFACYAGVFPARPAHTLRVECIPERELQQAYAQDAELLASHLRQVGVDELGTTVIPRCQLLADTPFQLEFQVDVDADGAAGSTFAASTRFANPPGTDAWHAFDPTGDAGKLMATIEEWGLADNRWPLLADASFAKRVTRGDDTALLYCFPAFVKLRWRDGNPLDAKAYLVAGVQ